MIIHIRQHYRILPELLFDQLNRLAEQFAEVADMAILQLRGEIPPSSPKYAPTQWPMTSTNSARRSTSFVRLMVLSSPTWTTMSIITNHRDNQLAYEESDCFVI